MSLKAHEVMKILNISRSTLSKYVKENKLNIIVNKHNGRYSYIPKSVFKLASNDIKYNIIYTRVSTYKQKCQLVNQISKLKNYCSSNNIIIKKYIRMFPQVYH